MANVFVSYARDDRARIQPLVSALEAEGLSVWWDPALIPGRRFRQMIAQELSSADSVLVIWTRQALESDWVQDEADDARQRGVLIPVIMEPVTPPAGFRQLQAADLSQWTGQAAHPEFKALVHACKALVQWAEQERAKAHAPAEPRPAETIALVANPEPVQPQARPKPSPDPEPEAGAAPTPAQTEPPAPIAPTSADDSRPEEPEPAQPPLPTPPPQLAPPTVGERIVRAMAMPVVGWGLGAALLAGIAFQVLTIDLEPQQLIRMAPLALVGPAAMMFSQVIVRRGLQKIAVGAAMWGTALAALLVLYVLSEHPPESSRVEHIVPVVVSVPILLLGGYLVGAALGSAIGPKTASQASTPAVTPPPVTRAELPATKGFVPGLLRFLAGDRAKWTLGAIAAVGGTSFMFSRDEGVAGLILAVLGFVTLPAAVMARSMLLRGLPKAPVIFGLTGFSFGLAYGLLSAAGALATGPFGIVGAVSMVIIAPLLGFVLFGGIANLFAPGPAKPPIA